MPAFDSPTINDFLSQLHMQTERAVLGFQKRKDEVNAQCAADGANQSSRHAILLLDALDEYVEKSVAILLGELRRALVYPELNPIQLREIIGPRLDELVSRLISAIEEMPILRHNQLREIVRNRIERIRSNVLFWLRQFDIGWDEPAEPEPLRAPASF